MEKPKFLSKQERAALALQRRAQEIEALKAKQSQDRQQNLSFIQNAQLQPMGAFSLLAVIMVVELDSHKSKRQRQESHKEDDHHLKPQELDLIRQRYIGHVQRPEKKKKAEKKFVFDWKEEEDTLKGDVKEARPLFGRGKLAGIDPREQEKLHQKNMDSLYKSRNEHVKMNGTKKSLEDERHWADKSLDEMTERDWRIFKEDHDITTKGGNIPHPIRSWKESGIDERILKAISTIGYQDPTPIQRQAIPIGMQNRDIIGIAETGSGKTAAFVIPMLSFILRLPKLTFENAHLGPYGIIMAPTRELVQQIEVETNKFAKFMGFTCVSVVGGHSIGEQAFNLRDGTHIIIATPGRLRDLLDRRVLILAQCTFVVLDEADRMVDLGFEEDLHYILDALPVSNMKPDSEDAEDMIRLQSEMGMKKSEMYRQTVMFSATMPAAVEKLAKEYLRRPAIVQIGQVGQVVDRIVQQVEMVSDDNHKRNKLSQILSSGTFEPPIILFVNQKKNCDILAKAVEKIGYRAATLHGSKSQDQREAALAQVKSGKKDILVATDVAGRGIDIKNVSLVLNYDMAKSIEDYTHRIGRTGRAGAKGHAITFLSPEDAELYYDLKQLLLKSPVSTVPTELSRHEAAQVRGYKLPPKEDSALQSFLE